MSQRQVDHRTPQIRLLRPDGRQWSWLRDLAELANAPAILTLASLERMLDLALALARRAAPETTEELARAIDAYHHYLDLG